MRSPTGSRRLSKPTRPSKRRTRRPTRCPASARRPSAGWSTRATQPPEGAGRGHGSSCCRRFRHRRQDRREDSGRRPRRCVGACRNKRGVDAKLGLVATVRIYQDRGAAQHDEPGSDGAAQARSRHRGEERVEHDRRGRGAPVRRSSCRSSATSSCRPATSSPRCRSSRARRARPLAKKAPEPPKPAAPVLPPPRLVKTAKPAAARSYRPKQTPEAPSRARRSGSGGERTGEDLVAPPSRRAVARRSSRRAG